MASVQILMSVMFSISGSSCDPVVTVVISCPVNEKTTLAGGFSKVS